MQMIDV